MSPKIAIIGAGLTGLASAVRLVDQGYQVTVFEANENAGGLASGFKRPDWEWSLESFYHHIFTSDTEVINLAEKVGARVIFKKPLTSSFFHQREVQLDSPISLLKFSGISWWARLRMGLGLAILKVIPNGLFLEKYNAVDFLPGLLGKEGYQVIWEKLLKAKFGPFVKQVNMAWYWSRVAKRSQRLGYFEGGFQNLVEMSVKYLEAKGGKVLLKRKINKITQNNNGVLVDGEKFDKVVMTVPATIMKKMITGVEFPEIDYLWGQTLVLETTQKLMKSYWLNILEENWPFLVMVEHTNFMNKARYGDKRLLYLGNYLPSGHPQLKMTKEQLLKLYSPFIKKINKNFKVREIQNIFLFREPYAQPVFPVNYSKKLPEMRSEINGVYLANMSMVYPFDRGTNYAVKMGREVAEMVAGDLK